MRSERWKVFMLILLVGGLGMVAWYFPVRDWVQAFSGWVQGAGWTGAAAFFLVYVTATVLGLPATPLTLAAGMIYGPIRGTLLVSPSSVAGALMAFLLGRTLLRNWVNRKIRRNARLALLDDAIGREGWRLVALLRLSPVFPFNLLNYVLGGTRVGLGSYLLASWIAMLPATFLYVSFGAAVGAAAGLQAKAPVNPWMLGLGILATLLVTLRVTVLARRALVQALPAGRHL